MCFIYKKVITLGLFIINMGYSIPIKDEELARRFRQAEKLYVKAQYEKPKIKYLKTHCFHCQKRARALQI